jgi:hypothetical protein
MKMPNIIESDDFNPKQIYDDLIGRAKQAKAWYVSCYIEEEWMPKGEALPFDLSIKDGVFTCRVVCSTYREAQTIVGNTLPVIKFIEDPNEK